MQGLYDLFGDALLFFELGLALLAFFAPVFVLFRHAIDVIGYKVYTLAERISALAQYLNGFLHKLDVVLGESALTPTAAATRRLRQLDAADFLSELFLFLATGRGSLLLRAKFADDFDTPAGSRRVLPGLLLIVILLHQLFSLLNECTVLSIARIKLLPLSLLLLLLLHHRNALIFLVVVLLLRSATTTAHISFGFVFSDDIRLFLLLLFLILVLGLCLFCLPLPSDLGLLPLPVLVLLLPLPLHLVLLLLLLALLLLVLRLLPPHLLFLFSLLSHHLLLHTRFLLCLSTAVIFFVLASEDLADVRVSLDAGSGRTEQLLQEVVGAIRLQTSDDLRRLNVDLLPDNHLCQRYHL